METVILGLDVAGCTGWAQGDGTRRPTVGHWKLDATVDEELGPYFLEFRNHLVRKFWELLTLVGWTEGEPTRPFAGKITVLFEAPVFPKPFLKAGRIIQHASIKDRRKIYGLVALVEMTCLEFGIRCEEVSVAEVKQQLTGKGNAEKEDMVAAAERMGCTITVHDEADAVGVFLCGVRHHAKKNLPLMDQLLYGRKGLL